MILLKIDLLIGTTHQDVFNHHIVLNHFTLLKGWALTWGIKHIFPEGTCS